MCNGGLVHFCVNLVSCIFNGSTVFNFGSEGKGV